MPEEKTITPEEETPEEEPEDISIKMEEYSDDEVIVSKADLQKLQEERKNYKQGMLTAKEKAKEIKEKSTVQKEEFVSKADFFKSVEEQAIAEASEDEVIEKNWKEILTYYSPRRGKNTVKAIKADIDDAKTLWEKDNPPKKKENKTAKAEILADNTKSIGETKGEKEIKTSERKIIPKRSPINDWYSEV